MKELEIRKRIKKKKPTFTRQDCHKKGEISNKWRRPKGLQSKMRLKKKGYKRSPSQGWRSPRKIKGFHKSGLKIKIITCFKDIESVDPKTECVLIGATVGKKKKIELLEKLKQVKVLCIKDVEKYINDVKTAIEKKNQEKKTAKKVKKEEEKTSEEKSEKKEETVDEKVKKEEERKEQQKVLTKKK